MEARDIHYLQSHQVPFPSFPPFPSHYVPPTPTQNLCNYFAHLSKFFPPMCHSLSRTQLPTNLLHSSPPSKHSSPSFLCHPLLPRPLLLNSSLSSISQPPYHTHPYSGLFPIIPQVPIPLAPNHFPPTAQLSNSHPLSSHS